MNNVELKEGTVVSTPDGKELGQINRFVLDPQSKEVTHLVIEKGWLFSEDKVIPFNWVDSMDDDKIVLDENVGDFDQLPPFEETYYVRADDVEKDPASGPAVLGRSYQGAPVYYWYPPYGALGYPAYGLGYYSWPRTETQQNIPENTIPLKESTKVTTADDKHVGNVERLLADAATNKVTHFLISEGVLFKDIKRVPANWIRSITEDEVRLSVSSSVLERLPAYDA